MDSEKEPNRYEGVSTRVQLLALAIALALTLLCARFWQLQIVNMHEYAVMARDNQVWEKRLPSDRGLIFGRNGEVLADNRASADIVFVPGECPEEQREHVVQRLEALLKVPADSILSRMQATRGAPFQQVVVKRDVVKEDRVRVEEHSAELPGVLVVVAPQRRYLYGETGGQILGFLGEISSELDEWKPMGYRMGDIVGKGGIERVYEHDLRGQDGYAVVTKYASGRPEIRTDRRGLPVVSPRDSQGHELREEAARRNPVSGEELYLTIDMGLQKACEDILRGEVGAIVVLNADTGGVLALASMPTYDPNVFVTRDPNCEHSDTLENCERLNLLRAPEPNPMFSRAYRENYPPGSVFKVLLAAAALEEGIIDEHSTFFCPGKFQINGAGRAWHCWRRSGHGSVNVREALAYSCDVFFYNVGLRLGVDKINEWSHKMGLGVKTGIDLPGENPALIPSPEWKAELFASKPVWDQKWYPGDTVNLSIGQGSAAATPLQCAVLTAAIVNGGYRIQPHLNVELDPKESARLLSEKTIEIVQAGMLQCVEKQSPAPTGTGKAAYIEGMKIMGKTGSAQVMSLKHHEQFANEEDIPYEFRDHAWFVAGVLDRSPRISVCILVEHGHHGSSAAAPLAKDVIEYFYREDPTPPVLARLDGTPQ
ncbi:MAG: penicillin-binding protein 2 [Candidatus Hydrogenedens sp.]|nr:penicillin-binding protein 2 [Candidatus Hydrogenedens sp.]